MCVCRCGRECFCVRAIKRVAYMCVSVSLCVPYMRVLMYKASETFINVHAKVILYNIKWPRRKEGLDKCY